MFNSASLGSHFALVGTVLVFGGRLADDGRANVGKI